jgi:hypothetical protein
MVTLTDIYRLIYNKNMYIYLLKIENFGVAIATLSLYVDPPLTALETKPVLNPNCNKTFAKLQVVQQCNSEIKPVQNCIRDKLNG